MKAPGFLIHLYWFCFRLGGSMTIFVSLACEWNMTWSTLLKCPPSCGDLDLQITGFQDAARLFFLFYIRKGGRLTSEKTFAGWIRVCMAEEYTKQKRARFVSSRSQRQYLILKYKNRSTFCEIVQGCNLEAAAQLPIVLAAKTRGMCNMQPSGGESYSYL